MATRQRDISDTRKIRIAAKRYARKGKPENMNSFITYLHEEFEPESQRKKWIHRIEINSMENEIEEILESEGRS